MTLFTRFRSVSLKQFLASGAVWLVLFVAARGLWTAGCYTAGRVQRVLQLIAWAESLTDGGGADLPPFFDRQPKRTGPLVKWIRKHLPRRPREETAAAAEAIRTAAGLLRSGDLHGERDTFAELTWRLETAVDYESWHPFLMELSARIDDELGGDASPEQLARLLNRVADTIDPQTASAPQTAPDPPAAEKEVNQDDETDGEPRRTRTEEDAGESKGESETETEKEAETRSEKDAENGGEKGSETGNEKRDAPGAGACPGGNCRYGWRYYGF